MDNKGMDARTQRLEMCKKARDAYSISGKSCCLVHVTEDIANPCNYISCQTFSLSVWTQAMPKASTVTTMQRSNIKMVSQLQQQTIVRDMATKV